MARYWWQNIGWGTAAFFIGLGLLLKVGVILQSGQLQDILFQFVGICLLLSRVMSLIWGFSNLKWFGLWIMAGILGIVGGSCFS